MTLILLTANCSVTLLIFVPCNSLIIKFILKGLKLSIIVLIIPGLDYQD
jgi:hypothetical protein